MKAWTITGPRKFELITQDRPIGPDETKVKISRAALTGADLAAYEGRAFSYPVFPGKLAVGFVSESGANSTFRTGEKVFISPYIYDPMRSSQEDHMLVMGRDYCGLLGDYVIVPSDNLYRLPVGVDDREAVFIDYIALAMEIINKTKIQKTQFVAILGCSMLSVVLAQLCVYFQAIPIIIDNNTSKLTFAQESGVYYTVNSSEEDALSAITSITGGNMADVSVFECRRGKATEEVFKYVRHGGSVCVVSENHLNSGIYEVDLKPIYTKELNIVGVGSGYSSIQAAINLLANSVVNVDNLSSCEGTFHDIPSAFAASVETGDSNFKTVISF